MAALVAAALLRIEATVWTKLVDVPAHPTNRVLALPDLLEGQGTRYYRLVTSAQP